MTSCHSLSSCRIITALILFYFPFSMHGNLKNLYSKTFIRLNGANTGWVNPCSPKSPHPTMIFRHMGSMMVSDMSLTGHGYCLTANQQNKCCQRGSPPVPSSCQLLITPLMLVEIKSLLSPSTYRKH